MPAQWRVLFHKAKDLRSTAPVDDDFPMLMHRFDAALRALEQVPRTPLVVCLCGSTKFKETFVKANFDLTRQGKIVVTVGWFSHADPTYTPTAEEKAALDELHKRKIDLADEILVLDVGGYIGESTRSEIAYAHSTGKPVRYLEGAGHEGP